jgi:hypothetical protein
LGGLDIHDLKRFGRALRLRWCWYQWKDDSKPWQGFALPYDEKDKSLFRASSNITIGNGKKSKTIGFKEKPLETLHHFFTT